MREQENNSDGKSLWRLVLAVVILCTAISLLGDIAAWVIHKTGGISFSVPSAATIGIIGGADGPTSVFIATAAGSLWGPVLKLLVLGIGVAGMRYLNRGK